MSRKKPSVPSKQVEAEKSLPVEKLDGLHAHPRKGEAVRRTLNVRRQAKLGVRIGWGQGREAPPLLGTPPSRPSPDTPTAPPPGSRHSRPAVRPALPIGPKPQTRPPVRAKGQRRTLGAGRLPGRSDPRGSRRTLKPPRGVLPASLPGRDPGNTHGSVGRGPFAPYCLSQRR